MDVEKYQGYTTIGKYKCLKTLGKGGTAKVKLGYDPSSQKLIAIKILKKAYVQQKLDKIQEEINCLSKLHHKNIIGIIDVQQDADYVKPSGKKTKETFIALELAPNGELFDYVAESGRFSEQVCRYYFKQLLDALSYCHEQGYAHRDLKPENVFFDEDFQLKLADFGFAALLNGKDGSGKLYTPLGTQGYMAPEIIFNKPYDGRSIDVFASGVILFIMLTGLPPFINAMTSDPYYSLLCKNKARTYWKFHGKDKPGKSKFFSKPFRSLLESIFAFRPEDRPTIKDIYNSEWMQGNIPTRQEVLQEFKLRKAQMDKQKELEKQQQVRGGGPMAYQGNGVFRDLDEELLKDLSLKIEFENLEKNFPNRNNERELDMFHEQGASATVNFVRTGIKDLTDFLLCILRKNCQGVEFDDEEYMINCNFKDNTNSAQLGVYISRVDKETLAVEFMKTAGCMSHYYKKVKLVKQLLAVLQQSEDDKAQNKQDVQQEEEKEDVQVKVQEKVVEVQEKVQKVE